MTQGELLAEIDKRPFEVQLAQAKGQLARDQALLASAKTEQERNLLGVQKGLIPKQQYDIQVATVGQYEGAIQADQAQIDNANLQITYSKIIAPISGQIGLRLVDEGNIVRAADPGGMIVITQLQPISVLFSIPEDNLGEVLRKLHAGQQLRVEAWDHDDIKKVADGILLTADNQIDATTGTSKLKAVFDNKNSALFPNQFVNVRLLIDTLKGAVVIPGAATNVALKGHSFTSSKTIRPPNSDRSPSRSTEGNDVALASGVEPGKWSSWKAWTKIQDGAKVDVQTPGQTPDGAAPACRRCRRSRWSGMAVVVDAAVAVPADGAVKGTVRPMNISKPFILRPVATSLLMLGVLLAGAVAYQHCRFRRCLRSIIRRSRS